MRKTLLTFALMLMTTQAHATDWCGKTIPGGTSVSAIKVTTLDQHQNCAGRAGIRLPPYSQLNLNGYTVSGATGACVRSIGTKYVAVKNGLIQSCGSDGVDFNTVTRPSISNLSANSNAGSGIRCLSCTKLTLSDTYANSNAQNGVKVEYGVNNIISRVTTNFNAYGMRLIHADDATIHDGNQSANSVFDVIFEQETSNSEAYSGSRGHVYFATGAFNNWTSHYVTCKSDGSGHGSNQCR